MGPLLKAARTPLMNDFRSMQFADPGMALKGPPPPPMAISQHFDLFRELPDSLFATLVAEAGAELGSSLAAIELRYGGGAMKKPAPDAGLAGHRDVPFSVTAMALLDEPSERARAEASMKDFAAILRPYATGGSFLNFLADPTRIETAYTAENYRRLAALKAVYDPDNFFRLNLNIPPAKLVAEPAGCGHETGSEA